MNKLNRNNKTNKFKLIKVNYKEKIYNLADFVILK